MFTNSLREAARYWEPRRLAYNIALSLQVAAWLGFTWPHFQPSFRLAALAPLIVLAFLANVCYTAAYLVEIPMQQSSFNVYWRERRWMLWFIGVLLALVFEFYWIADEIYPYL